MAKSKTTKSKATNKRAKRTARKTNEHSERSEHSEQNEPQAHWGRYSERQGETCDRLIDAALRHIAFDGFSESALIKAAQDANIDNSLALSLFPEPESDMIAWHSMLADTRMVAGYVSACDSGSLRTHERIHALLMMRFEQNAPHREAIRIALRKLAHPSRSALSLRLLSRTCDTIWQCAGDTSTDWNFYTKRTLLAGVYAATLPVWLDDETDDLTETDAYLSRRLQDVLKIGKCIGKLNPDNEATKNPLRACVNIATRPARFLRALSRYTPNNPRSFY